MTKEIDLGELVGKQVTVHVDHKSYTGQLVVDNKRMKTYRVDQYTFSEGLVQSGNVRVISQVH